MSHEVEPQLARKIEKAIGSLPPKQREIFLAKRLDQMSYAEIACRTGLTVPEVKRYMARALDKLLKQLDGEKLSWWERWF